MSNVGDSPENDSPEAAGEPLTLTAAEQAAEMAAYERTLRRVQRGTLWLGAAGTLASLWLSWPVAVGVLLGAVFGLVNFRWLAASVNAIGERIVNQHSSERGAAAVVRGVARIFLMALVAYGIFSCSVRSLVGYLAGLAMPVFALMCEAAYEFVAGNRRT
ncbi:MAG: ATP synthase subunit I [Acidobacteriota bacterium]|nr:ATP synthase subunit I [Acidobacteriota bacterium]